MRGPYIHLAKPSRVWHTDRQIEIDLSHPLARDIVAYWAMGNAGDMVDLVAQQQGTHSSPTNITDDVSINGACTDYVSSAYTDLPSLRLTESTPFGMVVMLETTTTGNGRYIAAEGNTGLTNPITGIYSQSGVLTGIWRDDAGGGTGTISGASGINDGKPHTAILTASLASNDRVYLYQDGVEYSSGTFNPGTKTQNTTTLAAMRRSTVSNHMISGKIYYAAFFKRQIEPEGALWLTESPRDILLTPKQRLFFIGDAAGGGTPHNLTLSSTSSSSSIDSAVITQTHALAVDDVAAAASMAGMAVSEGAVHDLTMADSASAGDVVAVALAQTHALSIDDVAAVADIVAVSLTQTHALAVDDVAAAASMAGMAVSEGAVHDLTMADSASAGDVVAVALAQTHALSIDDAVAVASMASVTVSEGAVHNLTVGDIAAVAVVESVAISQSHALVCADLMAQASLDAIAVAQTHNLTALPAYSDSAMPSIDSFAARLGNITRTELISITPKRQLSTTTPARTVRSL